MIEAVGIVIPVHDEAAHLPACLAALDEAMRAAPVPCVAVIVLDACSDASSAIAAAWQGPARHVLAVDFRNVGRARSAGMDRVLEVLKAHDAGEVWLSSTDADSLVPRTWLGEQLQLANDGADAVAGSIHVHDWSEHPPGMAQRFQLFYAPVEEGDSHSHVHGANLGVRACAYLAVGGFAPLATGEDHALWLALRNAKRTHVSSRRCAVTTSARLSARAPEGFSGFLAAFAATG